MAGDWIKMRADLHTHPKVVRISSALKADRLRVIGALHAVWCLFDAHSEDGTMHGYTSDALDNLIGWAGFSDALSAVGWIDVSGDSLSVPRFSEHNGRSAKRRAQETERKRTDRKTSASEADKMRTREEKRREDIKVNNKTKAAPFDVRGFLSSKDVSPQVCNDWLLLREKKKAPPSQTALQTIVSEAAKAGISLSSALTICCERGWTGFKAEWTREGMSNGKIRESTVKSFTTSGRAGEPAVQGEYRRVD